MLQGTNNNDMLSVNSFQMPPFTGGLSIGNFTINRETPVQSTYYTALHAIPLLFFLCGVVARCDCASRTVYVHRQNKALSLNTLLHAPATRSDTITISQRPSSHQWVAYDAGRRGRAGESLSIETHVRLAFEQPAALFQVVLSPSPSSALSNTTAVVEIELAPLVRQIAQWYVLQCLRC